MKSDLIELVKVDDNQYRATVKVTMPNPTLYINDYITELDVFKVLSTEQIMRAISSHHIGKVIDFHICDNNIVYTFTYTNTLENLKAEILDEIF